MNMQKLMAEAQKMQRDMTKKQDQLALVDFVGTSEFCDITLKGDGTMSSLKFKVDKLDEDDMEALEDMIKIAFNDANAKVKKESDAIMGNLGGMSGLF